MSKALVSHDLIIEAIYCLDELSAIHRKEAKEYEEKGFTIGADNRNRWADEVTDIMVGLRRSLVGE